MHHSVAVVSFACNCLGTMVEMHRNVLLRMCKLRLRTALSCRVGAQIWYMTVAARAVVHPLRLIKFDLCYPRGGAGPDGGAFAA